MTMGATDQYASYMLEHRSPLENAKTTKVAATSAMAAFQKVLSSAGTMSSEIAATAKAKT
jgi:hypothetical protein